MPNAPSPAQISARVAMSFSPMPPVKTSSPSKLGATFLELQYLTNSLVVVPAPPNAPNDVSMNGHMLELPTGQIWFSDFSKDVEIYTPTTSAVDNSWRPVVQDINSNAVATSCLGIFSVPPHP